MIEDERSSAFNEDAYVEELQAECRKLREKVAHLTALLLVDGAHSHHAFEVLTVNPGGQRIHHIRDVYYGDPNDPFSKTRIIIA